MNLGSLISVVEIKAQQGDIRNLAELLLLNFSYVCQSKVALVGHLLCNMLVRLRHWFFSVTKHTQLVETQSQNLKLRGLEKFVVRPLE